MTDLDWLIDFTRGEWFDFATHVRREGSDDLQWLTQRNDLEPADEGAHWYNQNDFLARCDERHMMKAIDIMRSHPNRMSASDLYELAQLCDSELTRRCNAVCGGVKYAESHWFERGERPPAGTICEVGTDDVPYEKCEILYYYKNQVALTWLNLNPVYLDIIHLDDVPSTSSWHFRPCQQ